jgi:hypothetical protein
MEALNLKNPTIFFQFVETRLKDETYIFDDTEALVEYTIQRAEPEHNIPAEINIEAVIPVIDEGNLSDEDLLLLLYPEAIDRIKTEIIEELV